MSLSKKKKIPFQSNSLHSAITYLTQVLQGSSEMSCLHDQYKNIISSDNLINYLCGDMAVPWRNQQIRRVLSSLLHSKSVTSGIQVIKPQNEKAGWRYKLCFFLNIPLFSRWEGEFEVPPLGCRCGKSC